MGLKNDEKRAWVAGELAKCRRKRLYVTAELAKVRAGEMKARAYRCRWCDMWHLTSMVDTYEETIPNRCPDCDSAQCAKSTNHAKACSGNRVYKVSERTIRSKFTEFLFG